MRPATEATPQPERQAPTPLLDITLPADTPSVPAARHAISVVLRDKPHHAERLDTVLLLATELLSNAVREGEGSVHLHVSDGSGLVRVEVTDGSQAAPSLRDRGPEATHGRGLVLVDALASSWGHHATSEGKTVWFVVS